MLRHYLSFCRKAGIKSANHLNRQQRGKLKTFFLRRRTWPAVCLPHHQGISYLLTADENRPSWLLTIVNSTTALSVSICVKWSKKYDKISWKIIYYLPGFQNKKQKNIESAQGVWWYEKNTIVDFSCVNGFLFSFLFQSEVWASDFGIQADGRWVEIHYAWLRKRFDAWTLE